MLTYARLHLHNVFYIYTEHLCFAHKIPLSQRDHCTVTLTWGSHFGFGRGVFLAFGFSFLFKEQTIQRLSNHHTFFNNQVQINMSTMSNKASIHEKALNLARRWSVQNENDLMQEDIFGKWHPDVSLDGPRKTIASRS